MTTAFTAMPINMTASAMRFLGGGVNSDMTALYSTRRLPLIDLDQVTHLCGDE
jgi:hypothetical protein